MDVCVTKDQALALAREVLRSAAFTMEKKGHRSRELLNYLLDRYMEGLGPCSQTALAARFFPQADPVTDSAPRRAMNRLRLLLKTFSEGEGRFLHLGIRIPLGSYTLEFYFKDDEPIRDWRRWFWLPSQSRAVHLMSGNRALHGKLNTMLKEMREKPISRDFKDHPPDLLSGPGAITHHIVATQLSSTGCNIIRRCDFINLRVEAQCGVARLIDEGPGPDSPRMYFTNLESDLVLVTRIYDESLSATLTTIESIGGQESSALLKAAEFLMKPTGLNSLLQFPAFSGSRRPPKSFQLVIETAVRWDEKTDKLLTQPAVAIVRGYADRFSRPFSSDEYENDIWNEQFVDWCF